MLIRMYRRRRTTGQRLRSILILAAILLLAVGLMASLTAEEAEADTMKVNYTKGEFIYYGTWQTQEMRGNQNYAYCGDPSKNSPEPGSYQATILGQNDPVRKVLYYMPGGYGYVSTGKALWFNDSSTWSEDTIYVQAHLVVSYAKAIYWGQDISAVWYGLDESNTRVKNAKQIYDALMKLPNPPASYVAFIFGGGERQNVYGSIYSEPLGKLAIQKSSANEVVSDGNGCYALSGAVYSVKNSSGKEVARLTTDAKGMVTSKDLLMGNYTMTEVAAPTGYAIDTAPRSVTVEADKTNTVQVKDKPQGDVVDIVLSKKDSELSTGEAQGGATFEGAEFTVNYYAGYYKTAQEAAGSNAFKRSWILKADEEGIVRLNEAHKVSGDELYMTIGGSPMLPLGTYTITETKAPAGYHMNSEVYFAVVTDNGVKTEAVDSFIAFTDKTAVAEPVIRGGVSIQKVDNGTLKQYPLGSATLVGTEFEITSLNEGQVLVDGVEYSKGQVVKTIKVTKKGEAAKTSETLLPFGKYSIKEVAVGKGYMMTDTIAKEFNIVEEGIIVELKDDQAAANQVKRGDIELIKVKDTSLERLANVPFKLTSNTTGESHIIVTDENGYLNTTSEWNVHSYKTNVNDSAIDKNDKVDVDELDIEAGIWFGIDEKGNKAVIDDELGALPFDSYTLDELECENNKGLALVKGLKVTIKKNNVTVTLGTLTDDVIKNEVTGLSEPPEGSKAGEVMPNAVMPEMNSSHAAGSFKTGDDFPFSIVILMVITILSAGVALKIWKSVKHTT